MSTHSLKPGYTFGAYTNIRTIGVFIDETKHGFACHNSDAFGQGLSIEDAIERFWRDYMRTVRSLREYRSIGRASKQHLAKLQRLEANIKMRELPHQAITVKDGVKYVQRSPHIPVVRILVAWELPASESIDLEADLWYYRGEDNSGHPLTPVFGGFGSYQEALAEAMRRDWSS